MKTKPILILMVVGSLAGSLLLSACGSIAAAQPLPTETTGEALPEARPTRAAVEPTLQTYTSSDYRLSFSYTPDWSLTESCAGQGSPQSILLELSRETYRVKIHIKFFWDETVIGGALGPGENTQDGSIDLLGQTIKRNRLVSNEQTKLVWYAGRFNDLELYLRIENSQSDYGAIDIPATLIDEVETILASFTRTGDQVTPPPESQPTTKPSPQPTPVTCTLTPRLSVNGQAKVTPGLPNAIRSKPGRGSDSTLLGEIAAGTTLRVLEGPVCASGYYWWRVDAGTISGWTAEGGQGIYWLEPFTGSESTRVDGWLGTLVSTPQWAQIDDCFQKDGQTDRCYGVVSLDLATRQELESYRDSGTKLRIWGMLYNNRMDANNTQIEVTYFEVMGSSAEQTQSVEDWWGVVVSNPVGSQFDDYFQLMDQNGTRYGIDSLDETFRQQLITLRDSGKIIRVWGTLRLDVPDSYGGQIQVTRFEYAH